MAEYELKFWFEHGGTCVWAMNETARNKFGYAVNNEEISVSRELKDELNALETRYHECLDWTCPSNPSLWSHDEKERFRSDAKNVYARLEKELGNDYHIISAIDECIYE